MKLSKIMNESDYDKACARLDELLDKEDNMSTVERIELELLANLIVEYEKVAYPIGLPSEKAKIKFRKEQMEELDDSR